MLGGIPGMFGNPGGMGSMPLGACSNTRAGGGGGF
jgi:hypothetical protein